MFRNGCQRLPTAIRVIFSYLARSNGRAGATRRSVAAAARHATVTPILLGGVIVVFAAVGPVAGAADITVDSLTDAVAPGDGDCTLREALMNANAVSGGDSTDGDCVAGDAGNDLILFDESLLGGNVTMALGQFEITDSVQLVTDLSSDRDNNITLNAGAASRVLDIHNPNNRSPMTVAIIGLGFTNGRLEQADASGAGIRAIGAAADRRIDLNLGRCDVVGNVNAGQDGNPSGPGGGVFVSLGDLLLRDCIVERNAAMGAAFGGGVALSPGNHELIDTVVDANTSSSGAGISFVADEGALTVRRSRITGNMAGDLQAGTGAGGGVLVTLDDNDPEPDGVIRFIDSTIMQNIAGSRGGGLAIFGSDQDSVTSVENSALIGNAAGTRAGALEASGANVRLSNSTVSGNLSFGTTALYLLGGSTEIEFSTITDNGDEENNIGTSTVFSDQGTARIQGSIIAGNYAPNTQAELGRGGSGLDEYESGGNNIIGSVQNETLENVFTMPNDQVDVDDPRLAQLDFYGGPTQAHELLPDSPALDGFEAFTPVGGAPVTCPPPMVDQRGMPRPEDGDNDGSIVCDIGAFENGLPMDLGDAPSGTADESLDESFPTLLADNGAAHIQSADGPLLGNAIDFEFDGQPSFLAEADDNFDGLDDEDGVQGLENDPSLIIGQQVNGEVTVTTTRANGLLNAWIDFDDDGAWQAGERIAENVPINAGSPLALEFTVPDDAAESLTYARFRVSSEELTGPDGVAQDGEVEDYFLRIVSAPDAPDTDGDGIDDDYEENNDLDPNDPSDAGNDPDNDGLTNLEEFNAGTQAQNPDSDDDGIPDGNDNEPTVGETVCPGADAVFENEAVQSGVTVQCAAENSILVEDSVTVESGGRIELYSPNVRFASGFSVPIGGEMLVDTAP